ncbi:MAG TPA: RidA family protein [Actinomycetota bacterium]|nr:RidA family protein [Actinomycetota bacterium]
MEKKAVNPWTWQDNYGFSQAIDVQGSARTVFCSGQTPLDADGNPQHAGDMGAQAMLALDNLETVLSQAGLKLSDVVRLNYFVTDIPAFMASAEVWGPRLQEAGCKPASTLLHVSGLFHPDVMIEIEATAAV